jgi:hypothetical protein
VSSAQFEQAKAVTKHLFDALAMTAESVAVTIEKSAEIHEALATRDPEAVGRAARQRKLAAAERAAAAAYRSGRQIPEDVRRAIRDAGPSVVPPDSAGH